MVLLSLIVQLYFYVIMPIIVCWLFSFSGFMVILQYFLGHLLRFLRLSFLLHLESRSTDRSLKNQKITTMD